MKQSPKSIAALCHWVVTQLHVQLLVGSFSLKGDSLKNFGSSVLIMLSASISLFAQNADKRFELPELHTIKTVTLSPSYSCRSSVESQQGYQNTALFLSAYSKQRNSPDLLFNGACRSEDYFLASTAGDDMSLIADLGTDVPLEEVSASRAFNLKRVHSYSEFSKFVKAVKVELNHTYAVLLNESDIRGLFVFRVVGYVPNEKAELRYAVQSYQIMPNGQIRSEGFDWEKANK
ncbi:MAG: hypothetical protein M3458_03695 [Acidobacteriota bacterium]|nr:hypothetical protein [Acidobacteriota bacterium]